MSSSARGVILCLLAISGARAGAAGLALDHALVTRSSDGATVELRLACPYRYVDHRPSSATRQTSISLVPAAGCGRRLAGDAPLREATRPAGRALAFIEEVEFVSGPDSAARISLRFTRAVSITVRQRGDLHSLYVGVVADEADAESGAAVTAGIESPGPGTDGQAEPDPERLRRAEERARRMLETSTAPEPRGRYVINLESTREPIDATDVRLHAVDLGRQLYTTQIELAGQIWHRLRLGFFRSEAEAARALAELRSGFPHAWIARVPVSEHQLAEAGRLEPADASPATPSVPQSGRVAAAEAAGAALDEADRQRLLADGRSAMIGGDYGRAIQLYTRLLTDRETPESQVALEYLGLARERNGQQAHAVAEYRRFLELYPEGPAADRVRQRLAGLTALSASGATVARRPVRRRRRASRWEIYGGVSQYYRRDETRFDEREPVVAQSSLLTDADVMVRGEGERSLFTARATLGNLYDLLGTDEGPGSSTRIYYLYADLQDEPSGLGARLGRQSMRSGGTLGRFDGVHLAWQWRPAVRLNLLGGFPVDSGRDGIDAERVFHGISMDLMSFLGIADVNLFYNAQQVSGIDDRQAIGGELRYYDDSRSLIASLDYDVSYEALNSLTLLGNWAFFDRVTVNAMFDKRRTPLLMTRNALIGQPVGTVDELLLVLVEDDIRQLALDRSGDVQSLNVGVSLPLYERFHVNADIMRTEFGGTPASGGVPAFPSTGQELYYSLNLIGSSLLKEGDSSILGLRYADGVNAATTSVYVDTRYPLMRGLRLNPRLRLSYREFADEQATEWSVAPALRILYRLSRYFSLELETGGEWSSHDRGPDSAEYRSFFVYGGYRADF